MSQQSSPGHNIVHLLMRQAAWKRNYLYHRDKHPSQSDPDTLFWLDAYNEATKQVKEELLTFDFDPEDEIDPQFERDAAEIQLLVDKLFRHIALFSPTGRALQTISIQEQWNRSRGFAGLFDRKRLQ